MADQAASGTMAEAAGNTGAHGLDAQTGPSHERTRRTTAVPPPGWRSRSSSSASSSAGSRWSLGPTWWLFWTGAGIVVVGGIFALSSHILDDWY